MDERINQMLRAVSSDPNTATVDDILSGEVFDMVAAYTRYALFFLTFRVYQLISFVLLAEAYQVHPRQTFLASSGRRLDSRYPLRSWKAFFAFFCAVAAWT